MSQAQNTISPCSCKDILHWEGKEGNLCAGRFVESVLEVVDQVLPYLVWVITSNFSDKKNSENKSFFWKNDFLYQRLYWTFSCLPFIVIQVGHLHNVTSLSTWFWFQTTYWVNSHFTFLNRIWTIQDFCLTDYLALMQPG